ncbi:MAG: OPT/YSL family transporter, partial [Planctomycetes bacterium]|nr:OPT/YSL family transporter [Planctomycetota bacterium]
MTGLSSSPVPRAEITPLSIGLGILVGLVMSVANVYLGLFAGMTVSASIPAAVISMGILKGVLRRGTIHENNIVQTVASAGESLAAGIIFTMPALVLAGVWSDFDFWTTTLVSMTGGLLGVLFMVPLR